MREISHGEERRVVVSRDLFNFVRDINVGRLTGKREFPRIESDLPGSLSRVKRIYFPACTRNFEYPLVVHPRASRRYIGASTIHPTLSDVLLGTAGVKLAAKIKKLTNHLGRCTHCPNMSHASLLTAPKYFRRGAFARIESRGDLTEIL